METVRNHFQGVRNIIAFNYPYYFFALFLFLASILLGEFSTPYIIYFNVFGFGLLAFTLISLLASFYVYDVSALLDISWLQRFAIPPNADVLNVHAGYDETSAKLHAQFPFAQLCVLDFYNSETHTERSIQRARKKHPPYPNTISVDTTHLPTPDDGAILILAFLSAHEIRDCDERILFFHELRRSLAHNGLIVVTEHLRNIPSFLVYTIGSFHFFSRKTWLQTFERAGFRVREEFNVTPLVRTFIIEKYDNTA